MHRYDPQPSKNCRITLSTNHHTIGANYEDDGNQVANPKWCCNWIPIIEPVMQQQILITLSALELINGAFLINVIFALALCLTFHHYWEIGSSLIVDLSFLSLIKYTKKINTKNKMQYEIRTYNMNL